MLPSNYSIKDDSCFIEFIAESNYSESSMKKYRNALKNYTNFQELTLGELLIEADDDEDNIIRIDKRKIKRRLILFRKHLIEDLNYKASTIKTNMICVKAFYKYNGIQIPEIKNIPLPKSPNDSIEFDDLPTIHHIKTAIESTKKQKHKALFLFALCTGSARKELAKFTFKQFLDGVNEFCDNSAKTPKDVINRLDGKCDERQLIPVFKMERGKTDYPYRTVITPECLQFMINYLKSEGLNLKENDPFFQLSVWGVSTAFKLINNKFNWGKRGTRDYFSSHRVRSLHASLIEEKDFANYIEGRKPNSIMQAYFKRDPNRIREKYKEHMHKFTIYAHYDVMLNSEAYNEVKRENKQLREENSELKNKLEAMEASQANIQTEMSAFKTQMDTIEENILENDITEFKKEVSKHPLIEEDGTLMELVMLMFKDKYKTDEITDSMAFIADELVTQAHVQKRADTRWRINWLKSNYGKKYDELREKLESIKEGYFDSLELDDIPKTWIIKVDKEILEFCEDVLINNNKLNELDFYETIESITGLKYANEISLMNNLEKNYGWMSKK